MTPGFSDIHTQLLTPLHTASCRATHTMWQMTLAEILPLLEMSILLTVTINCNVEKSRSNDTVVAIRPPSSYSLVSKHCPSMKEARTLRRKADSKLGKGKTNLSLKQRSSVKHTKKVKC